MLGKPRIVHYIGDEIQTGITSEIVKEDSDEYRKVYYDLKGHRLSAPQSGINIVTDGPRTTKVLIP